MPGVSRLIRVGILLLVLSAAFGRQDAGAAPLPHDAKTGLWVPAEGSNATLDNLKKIRALVAKARSAGVTDLFVQVYRGGRAWYPTRLADDAPSRRAGRDPLAYLIGRASSGGRGIRVHAWINAFSLARNREAPILRQLGPEAVLHDNHGRSLLDYPPTGKPAWAPDFGLGTPGIYLDPAHPGPRKRLAAIAAELVRRYPKLAGIHLDYIRYPYALPISPGSRFSPRLDFGYGKRAADRFRAETGLEPPLNGARRSTAEHQAWDAWRRLQVTETVKAVDAAIRTQRMGVLLSAAVLPWADRAYLSSFQDWRNWLQEGLLDMAVLMNYTRDEVLAAQISRSATAWRRAGASAGGRKGEVLIGLGAYLFREDPEPVRRQWRAALRAGADGVALFSYDTIFRNGGFWIPPLP